MPLDTTEFDKRIAESKFSGTDKTGSVTGQGEAVMQLALEVVKANFPDLVARTHSKVSRKEPTSPGATGEYTYGLAAGESDGIRLKNTGQWSPAARSFVPSPEGIKQGLKQRNEVNFTTQEVMAGVETVLHEMYHGRSRAGFFNAGEEFSKLTPQQTARVNEIANLPESGYPQFGRRLNSMNENYLNTEEFMANADALLSMKERLRIPEGSHTAQRLVTLEKIISEVPEVAKFIAARREPNVPTLKEPPQGTLGALLSKVDAFLNDYSVKETAGGAKPGTSKKKD
jgi:hypothetical protein